MKLTILHHAGNPNMCRIPELEIRAMPECEGGGWYISKKQAEELIEASKAAATLKTLGEHALHLWTHRTTQHLYTKESIADFIIKETSALTPQEQK